MFSSGPWLADYIVDHLGRVILPPSAVYSWLFLQIAANKLLVHITLGHNIGLRTAISTPTSAGRCTTTFTEVSPTKMWNLSRIAFTNLQKSRRHSYAIPSTIFSLQNDSCFMRGFYTLDSHESGGLIPHERLRNKNLLWPDCARAAKAMSYDSSVNSKVCEKNYGVNANSEPFDVAIIGGGMVGLALASALSSTPFTKHLNVAIVDPNPALGGSHYYIKNEIPSSRVSTVTPATISFLRDIGAWEHVKHQRHAFFDQMQVWDYTGLGYTRYCARDVGKEYLGCVVENKVLCNSLLLSLQEKDFKKTIIPAKLTSMTVSSRSSSSGVSSGQSNTLDKSRTDNSEETAEWMHLQSLVRLELSDGQHIYSKLVVGADGAKSRVREMAGIKTTGWDYSQSGLICTVEHTGENHCAWQRFLPSGPIALLPIGDNFSNIVWTMSSNEASRHNLMSEDDFVKAVNYALDCGYGPHPQSNFLDDYVGRLPWGSGTVSIKESFQAPPKVINVVSERMAFPLSLMHALEYSSRQFVLIGDAAHTVHPLAGQGVNLGFGDASTLTKVISEGISVGTDFADLALLKRYEKERKAANIPWMAILDGFQKAYSIDFGPINLIRAAAFHGAQYIAPLKRNIVSYAMGDWKWPRFT